MATTAKGGESKHFPPIVLDTTLHELLSQDSNGEVTESLCNAKPNSDPQYETIPLNRKFLITSSHAPDGNDLAHLQLENVSYLLSFWAGPMELVLIACEGWSDDDTLSKKGLEQNATRSFGILTEEQRPKVRAFANAQDCIQNFNKGGNQLMFGFATDFAEGLPTVLPPETTYRLNAKRWLAECDLRSANDQIIDVECSCSTHMTPSGQWFFGGSGCGECEAAMEKEIVRLRAILEHREPPYVLKLTQALGAVGTSLVKTKEDQADVLEHITRIQRTYLPRIRQDNAHIHPASLILSDFLPGKTMAINFFIRRDGSPVFVNACHQLSTRGGAGGRQQTALTYPDQEELEKKYKETLAHIGRVLHAEGYYGPAGADIMETEDGTQYVIDLNVRSATSLILGLLKGHCKKRGFGASVVFECLLLSVSRDELESKLEKEFEEGRIILLGTTKFSGKDVWAYPVVLAGEDQEKVKQTGEKILEFEAFRSADAGDAGGA